jgi:diguanylate cyclase
MAGLLTIVRAQAVQLSALARSDPLTGVANRRTWDFELSRACQWAREHGAPLSVALLDLDHFKNYNDRNGHLEGDALLRELGLILRNSVRQEDVVARYGGEEFAVIMPRTPLREAARIADQIRSAIEAKRLVRRSTNETIGAVTVSFGAALYSNGETVGQVIARADECLYMSKRNGRNRVTLETALPPLSASNAA